MSTITVVSKEYVRIAIDPHIEQIRNGLMKVTAEVLDRDPRSVIVDFQNYGQPEPENAPDILFRAETSPWNRDLLAPWGLSLVTRWHYLMTSLEIPLLGIRIAAKPYVLDSEWIESK